MTTRTDLHRRLDAHLARAARRVRARRLVVALSAGGVALAVVGVAAAGWEAADGLGGVGRDAGDLTGPLRPVLMVLLLGACVAVWLRGVRRGDLAREVDRRLGLCDRTASALAIARGELDSPLAEVVLADSSAHLDAAAPRLAELFPSRPRAATLRALRAASTVVALAGALVLLSRLVGSQEGGGRSVPFVPGQAPRAPDDIALPPDGKGETPVAVGGESEAPASPPPADRAEPEGDDRTDPPAPDDPAEPPPPAPAAAPRATAELVLSAEEFRRGDPVLALAVARPGAGLARPEGFALSLEIDGRALGTGQSTELDPSEQRGTLTPLRLGHLPGGAELLQPGTHEAVLVLRDAGGAEVARSEPRSLRIRGDDEDDRSPQQPSAPPPLPDEQPTPPPGPLPPPDPPESAQGDDGPAPEDAPPQLPEDLDRKVVVPLFGEGETVEKTGPRLVLVPGAGPDTPPTRVPLDEALDDAQRRAERSVDRGGVRAEDRDLVRRYFEALRRLAGEGR